jgi:tetratricopeptide (TPR) repeat protein
MEFWRFLKFRSSAQRASKDALLAIKEKRYEDAISLLAKPIQKAPNQYLFYFFRGLAHQKLDQWDAAFSDYNHALTLKPNHAPTVLNRGILHLNKGELKASVDDFSEAIRLGYNAYAARAAARFLAREPESALTDIDEAISLEPVRADHFVIKSSILRQLSRNQEAIVLLNHAIEMDPQHLTAHNNLAWFLATSDEKEIRDGKRALGYALKAVGTDANPPPAYIGTLAAAYAEAGQFENAVKWARHFLENNPPAENRAAAEERLRLYQENKPYREERGKFESVRDTRVAKRRS